MTLQALFLEATSNDFQSIRIDNPLANQEPAQLEAEVEEFHKRVNLNGVIDLEILIRGARIAQRRWGDAPPGFTPAEYEAIKNENSKSYLSFLQTRGLLVTVMATACAAITQGWQQSTINSSSLFLNWDVDFDLQDKLVIGFINAAPWLLGSLIGTWLSDPLQERFGRRPALFISAVFCVALVIGTARCTTWKTLLVCRVLLGVGIGSKASIAPIFAAEAAPDRHRGKVLMMWQLFDALGIFLGFLCALIVMDSWRVLLATAIIPAIVLLFLVFMCPESPRFLIQRNRYPEAYKSLLELRGTPIQAARDLYYIHAQLQTEAVTVWDRHGGNSWWSEGEQIYAYQKWINKGNFFKRMMYLATDKRTRRACTVASIVMASQQLCGINVLTFYSSSILHSEHVNAGEPSEGLFPNATAVKWYNFAFGLANFLFTFPAYIYIDLRGRRPLLLVSFIGMFFSLVAFSGFFEIAHHDTRLILVAVFASVFFVFFYSIGAGPIPFTLSAEVFPLCVREVGMSFSVMINFLGLGLLVLFVPELTKAFGRQAHLLFFFSGMNVLTLILIFLLVPETKDVSLENMNSIFNRATKEQVLIHAPLLEPLYPKT
ncbi:hypothetical protein N7489_002947 [Penicillium chrysogenum]|uniref:Major facilitator superfamily (MFS) profile domain-containing protein n=1 Tax=Penicillium chrysogenum TaxID=5076 RepID=A0ABQ8WN15_PENCH|nr:uncharacterized protein N7489_002947 [Penicillium chrysogenum]KAJ5252537.1 hypothetical protein N7489_002947 [Penicillium chrysogenum]KAJ5254312.1 hypothetical protein N7524_011492 [Penicillium chrysogenum]KAJ5271445.1 hypothetical protein N7505_007203 [Penicillium chrysogenum]